MGFRGTALLGLILAFAPGARGELGRSRSGTAAPEGPARRGPSSLRAPSAFEPNRGQADPSVSFLARARGCFLYLQGTGAILAVPRPAPAGADPMTAPFDRLAMRFPGARASAFRAEDPLPGLCHYLVGRDESRWVRDVPRYAGAACRGLWPGVDLRWQVRPDGTLEYSFLLAAGADSGVLAVEFEGQESMALDRGGDLLLRTAGGPVRHTRPEAWQEVGGARRPVAARFDLRGGGRVGIDLGPVDPALPVVVDPKILASTYFGGSNLDTCRALALDGQGRPVIAGYTYSTNLPVASAFMPTNATGTLLAFVSRLSADGSALVSSTYLGASNGAQGFAVAADAAGAMYVGGTTNSYNFPVKNPFQAELNFYDSEGNGTNNDAFVTKLASTGSSLVWSTYIGSGGAGDTVQAMAVASTGELVVGGFTQGKEFPITAGQKGFVGSNYNNSGFVTKFSAAGNTLAWSTYVGGEAHDGVNAVSLAPDDAVCFAGFTESTSVGVVNAYQASYAGARDCMVGRFPAGGGPLSWLTYLGSSGRDEAFAVAAASDGGAFVVGTTSSPGFPVYHAIQGTYAGNADAFVSRLGPTGSTLTFSTFLGGSGAEAGNAAVLDAGGYLWVAGSTASTNFPVALPVQAANGGGIDAFVAVLPADGSDLRSSTYLGGSQEDVAYGIGSPEANVAWVGGLTTSLNFPYLGGYDSTNSSYDAFLTSVADGPRSPTGVAAELVGLTEIDVAWIDRSDDESGFAVERKAGILDGPGPWVPLGAQPPGAVFLHDPALDPDTSYTYRVKATGAFGDSAWAVGNTVTTPPAPLYPPVAPSDIVATVVSPRRVDLAWSDNSLDEDFFVLARAQGASLFGTLSTPHLGAIAYTDATVLPERTYSWKIRAQNPLGPSLFSNTATVTMPSTLDVAVTKGKIADKAAFARDALSITGTFAYGTDAVSTSFDPAAQGFALRLGDLEAPPLVDIPAAVEGWTLRRGRFTWRSPRGSLTKAKVVVDTLADTWSVKLGKLTLSPAPSSPLRATLTLGTDTGHVEADWTVPTPGGVTKFPVPAPK